MANSQKGAVILTRDDAERIFNALLQAKRDSCGHRMRFAARRKPLTAAELAELAQRQRDDDALNIAIRAIGMAHGLGGW